MDFSADLLRRFWPNADPAWRDAFLANWSVWGERYNVNTPLRWRHFLAQVSAETDGLNTDGQHGHPLKGLRENLRYRPSRVLEVYGYRVGLAMKRYPGRSKAQVAAMIAGDWKLLAETVYGNRPKDLGNSESGDGWKYIGRGPLQVTGRYWYSVVAKLAKIDCLEQPELLEVPRHGWEAAFIEWSQSGCNALADTNDVTAVSKKVNGGTNGLAARREWLKRAEALWPADVDVTPDLDMDARDESTLADLAADGSRKAQVVRVAKGAGATLLAAPVAIEAAKPAIDAIGEATGHITIITTFGRAAGDLATFIAEHGNLVVGLVGAAVLVGAVYLGKWMVEDYREGRYHKE